jgi:hypothetical protein
MPQSIAPPAESVLIQINRELLYYRNNVVGGPGAFVMVAENFNSFGQAILNKLISEIAANPYPKQAQLR